MSQEYDKIMKENIEAVILPLADKLFGISPKKMEEIPDELQRTIERKPDFLKRVTDKNGAVYILQIEFQSTNETKMVLRMLEYKSMLMHKYGLPVKQFVIYLGNAKLSMKSNLQQFMPTETAINFSYNLLNIKDFQAQKLLESDIPEEIILAILGNYPKKDAVNIIKQIIDRLQQVVKNSSDLQLYIRQLSILSKLRNLQDETIKNIEAMPIHFDIETDVIYKRGKLKGIEIGKEKNLEKNISKIIVKTDWSDEKIAKTLDVPIKLVKKIRLKVGK